MGYADTENRLRAGGIVILDGGTGTELQRRGISMDPQAWCGPASLENTDVLEAIHRDYIAAGADIITANTYASSRLMLAPAGFGDRFAEINGAAIVAAQRAREASGRPEVLIAGSLSHMCPMKGGSAQADIARAPSPAAMADGFGELARLLCDQGCDLILLEMMYDPDRMECAFKAAADAGLPVWAGFSARQGKHGQVLSFAPETDVGFEDIVGILADFDVGAAGVMHTASNIVADALDVLRKTFTGPLMAYPDSGYFKMPQWQFEETIAPGELLRFARQWVQSGVQIVGGCCGLTPDHIAALEPLRNQAST
jgi:homocysteine S-methyltransferase